MRPRRCRCAESAQEPGPRTALFQTAGNVLQCVCSATELARLSRAPGTEPFVKCRPVVACTTPERKVGAAIKDAETGHCSLLHRAARLTRPGATAGTACSSNEVPHGREAETTGAQPIRPLGRVLARKEVAEAGRAITRPVWPEEARLRRLLGTVPHSAPPEAGRRDLRRHGEGRTRP